MKGRNTLANTGYSKSRCRVFGKLGTDHTLLHTVQEATSADEKHCLHQARSPKVMDRANIHYASYTGDFEVGQNDSFNFVLPNIVAYSIFLEILY